MKRLSHLQPSDQQAVLASPKAQPRPYPVWRVLLGFTGLGGATGGGIIWAFTMLPWLGRGLFTGEYESEDLAIVSHALLMFMLFGGVLGALPALLTGMAVAHQRIYRPLGDVQALRVFRRHLWRIGFVTTAFVLVMGLLFVVVGDLWEGKSLMIFFENPWQIWSAVLTGLALSVLGGASAVIVGRWVVPRS